MRLAMRRSTLAIQALASAACAGSTTVASGAPGSALATSSSSISASAGPSTTPARTATATPSCDPACQVMALQSPAFEAPGELPAGDFTTGAFYPGGLTVTLTEGWKSHEDSTGEFSLERIANPDDNLVFWVDVTPTTWSGMPVTGIANTAAAVSAWLHAQDWMTVTAAKHTTIGKAKLPALVMDITLPPSSPNGDPGCPVRSCVAIFRWPQWDDAYAMAADMHVRLYLAGIGDGPHLLYALFNVVDADEFAPFAQPVLDSVVLSPDLG
jgi:hypothetical protein